MSCSKSKNSNNKKNSSKQNCDNNQNTDNSNYKSQPRLCVFTPLDYLIISSAIAYALYEELDRTDFSIVSNLLQVIGQQMALISSVEACPSNDSLPQSDVILRSSPSKDRNVKSKNKNKAKKSINKKSKKKK